ncbi:MAG TPA: hypothetical protein VFA57_13745 [Pseudolabrys sp.]|nr:hypothetical protein [Pseudolabrys sp.]
MTKKSNGCWNEYDAATVLAEEKKKSSTEQLNDIWPHWSEGVPNKLRRTGWAPPFRLGAVDHHGRLLTDTLELDWEHPHALSFLCENKNLLPGDYTSLWSGVYRVFAPETTIRRFAAKTPLARYTSDGLAVAGEIGRHSVPESNQFCLRDIMQLQTGGLTTL